MSELMTIMFVRNLQPAPRDGDVGIPMLPLVLLERQQRICFGHSNGYQMPFLDRAQGAQEIGAVHSRNPFMNSEVLRPDRLQFRRRPITGKEVAVDGAHVHLNSS